MTTIPPHQRAVSDIGWSPYEPNVLVTASLDSYPSLILPPSYMTLIGLYVNIVDFDGIFATLTCGMSEILIGLCQ